MHLGKVPCTLPGIAMVTSSNRSIFNDSVLLPVKINTIFTETSPPLTELVIFVKDIVIVNVAVSKS